MPRLIRFGFQVILAHAISLALAVRLGHQFPFSDRRFWFASEFTLALLLFPLVRCTCDFLVSTLKSRRSPIVTVLGLSLFISIWRWGEVQEFAIHPGTVGKIVRLLLPFVHFIVALYLLALSMAITIRYACPTEEPSRGVSDRHFRRSTFFWCLLFLIATNLFAIHFLARERTIYVWDHMVYWSKSGDFAEELRTKPLTEVASHFRSTVKNEPYGLAPALLPALIATLFGDSRMAYVLTILNTYFLMTALAASRFLKKSVVSDNNGWSDGLPFLAVALSPTAWSPLLYGYLDICGVVIGILLLQIYLSAPAGELPWYSVIQLGALCLLIFLLRRWYAFFVVAFFAVLACEGFWTLAFRHRGRPLWPLALNFLAIPGWFGLFLLAIVPERLFSRTPGTSAHSFKAYQIGENIFQGAEQALRDIGYGWMFLVILSTLYLLNQSATRRLAIVIFVMCPVILASFLQVQGFGIHHLQLFLPALILLPCSALQQMKQSRVRRLALLAYLAWNAVAMTALCSEQGGRLRNYLVPFVPDRSMEPMIRDDLNSFRELARRANQESQEKIFVLGSSPVLNPTMFLSCNRSLQESIVDPQRVWIGGEVDRVNLFPKEFFRADVIVTSEQPQIHLAPAEQQCILITHKSLIDATDIGAAFEKLPGNYLLQHPQYGTAVAVLYHKRRPITREEFQSYVFKLQAAHPDEPAFYTPPPDLIDELFTATPR